MVAGVADAVDGMRRTIYEKGARRREKEGRREGEKEGRKERWNEE